METKTDSSQKPMSNIELFDDHIQLTVNPKIYPLDVVYSAAYIMLDKSYIIIDGNPEDEIIVEIRPKEISTEISTILNNLGNQFNNELINYAVYKTQSEKNKDIRQTIIQRALLTNGFDTQEDDDDDYLDDPEGIAVPWEDKYGDKADEKSEDEKHND